MWPEEEVEILGEFHLLLDTTGVTLCEVTFHSHREIHVGCV